MANFTYGNPFDQFVQDLICGLTDGTIVIQNIDVQRQMGDPFLRLNIEAVDTTGGLGSRQSLVASVAALPGAKQYGIKLSDSTEPVAGFRDFSLTESMHGLVLRSRNGAIWPHYKRLRAMCNDNPLAAHDVPSLDCECGVYAYDSASHPSLKMSRGSLWGEIKMWGDVIQCETGFRAEFAYPSALFILDSKASKTVRKVRDELAENYGVPVLIVGQRTGKTASEMIQAALDEFLTT